MRTSSERNGTVPIACNLDALTPEQRARASVLRARLRQTATEVREMTDGWAFRFEADTPTLSELAEFIALERLCCPFFAFRLEVPNEGGAVRLELTGRPGVKEFIEAELGL